MRIIPQGQDMLQKRQRKNRKPALFIECLPDTQKHCTSIRLNAILQRQFILSDPEVHYFLNIVLLPLKKKWQN